MCETNLTRKYLKWENNKGFMYYLTTKGKNYLEEWRRLRKDFSNNIPGKLIEEFPVSGNEGLYGWTFLPDDGKIRRREDLRGTDRGLETDIHENIHTPDERETRYLTAEILKGIQGEKRGKYEKSPPGYNR